VARSAADESGVPQGAYLASGVSTLFEQGPQGPAGPPGRAGKQLLSGSGAPSNTLGNDGDHYLDRDANTLYGAKANGVWGSGVSLGAGAVADDIAMNGSFINRVHGFNGTALETTDTPSTGDVWSYDPSSGKYRSDRPLEPAKLNVKAKRFGAVGDGTTDDTTAINACIAAANALNEPVIVLFPPGTYKVTAQLTTPDAYVSLHGAAHRGTATIKSYVHDTLLYLDEAIDTQNAKYLSVENLNFECMVDQSADAGWLAATAASQTIAVDATAGTFTRSSGSFVTDGFQVGQRILPAGFANAANNYGRVIQSVTPTVITVTSTTGLVTEAGTGNESISSPFEVAAGAGIEIRGGGKIQLRNVNAVNFPIGFCLDGAIEVKMDHCLAYSNGDGYGTPTTNGKGIYLVDGGRRGRGFTVGGSVNCNQIKHCWLGGNKNDIEVNGGLSNQIEDIIFASVGTAGLSAIRLTATDGIDIFACECEGYGGSGSCGVMIGGAVYGATIRKNYLSAEHPISSESPGVMYKSSIVDNTLNPTGSNAAVYKWDPSCMPYLVCTGNTHNGAGSFTNYDGGDAAIGFNNGPTTQKGLSINKIGPARGVIDAYLADATSLIRFSAYPDPGVVRFDHSAPSAKNQTVEHFYVSDATSNLSEDGKFVEWVNKAAASGSSTICQSTAIPVDALVTARWTVLQQKDGTITTYGSWIYEQDVYRNGSGSLTFVGSPTDVKGGGAVNVGATFTAPTLVDAGSNKLGIAVSGIAGTASLVFAKLEIFACVR